VELVIHDLVDLIDQPMHRLGLHTYSWVIVGRLIGKGGRKWKTESS
jgi:hypothetical protein